MRSAKRLSLTAFVALLYVGVGAAQEAAEDAAPGFPFKEGAIVTFDELEKLREYLPPEFWKQREFFFYEGMQLEIGPFFRDYPDPPVYREATEKYHSQASLGKDGALVGHVAARPFPDKIDCKGDPSAGLKIIWNFSLFTSRNMMQTSWGRGS